MKLFGILALAVVLTEPTGVAAQFIDGNKLHSQLQAAKQLRYRSASQDMFEAAGQGYVMGIADSHSGVLCIQPGVNFGQLIDIVTQYLETHPAERHWSAATLVLTAIAQQFPCPKVRK
jgi:hypothetical protein